MSTPEPVLGPLQAKQLVRARLGRDPQDMYEAAVVLEAWGGMSAGKALERGRALVAAGPTERLTSVSTASRDVPRRGFAWEAIAFVVAILAIAWWAAPLGDAFGRDAVERALVVALPATLALQWALSSRYLNRAQGLAALARVAHVLVGAALLVVLVPWAVGGAAGALAGALVVTWTGGVVLIRRRWAAAYATIVIAATAAMALDAAADAVMAATAAATVLAVLAALSTLRAHPGAAAGRWTRTLLCAAIGGGLGALLVADPTVQWSAGPIAAVALLPSTLAGLWSGYHLWQFQHVLVRSLCGRPVDAVAVGPRQSAPLRILGGAVARLVLGCVVLSAGLLAVLAELADERIAPSVLVGFALVALATLLLSFLTSVERTPWALAAVLAALVAKVALVGLDLPADGLVVAGAVAVLVALPVAVASLSRPEATLATTLWIP